MSPEDRAALIPAGRARVTMVDFEVFTMYCPAVYFRYKK